MIEQFLFCVYVQRKWKQDIEEIYALPGSLHHYSQSKCMKINPVSITGWIDKEHVV